MKKFMKLILISMSLVLVFSISFFIPLSKEISSTANISGVSGQTINLTGYQNALPYHYFTDGTGKSNLKNIDVIKADTYYINENNEETNKFYVMESLANTSAFGMSTMVLPKDMEEFAQTGSLYVQVGLGVEGFEENDEKLTISLASGEEKITSSINLNQSTYYRTQFIKVTEDVVFNFESTINQNSFRIFEPKLIFKVVLDELSIEAEKNQVSAGGVVKINAASSISHTESQTQFSKYFRVLHDVKYEIISGGDFFEIINDYIYINDNISQNTTIEIQATALKDTFGDEKITSETISIDIVVDKSAVKIQTDFENPATFTGQGTFSLGDKIVLGVLRSNYGFKFVKWVVNGEEYFSTNVPYVVQVENDIQAVFIKQIYVDSIIVKDKEYDGSTDAELEVIFEGKEEFHDLHISITASFINANVGENKEILFEGSPVLSGEHSSVYYLNQPANKPILGFLQNQTASISKNIITVTASEISQTYGSSAEKMTFSVNKNVNLKGDLERVSGNDVGSYEILEGTIIQDNPNYEITFVKGLYVIQAREISVDFVQLEKTKVYDKTRNISYEYEVANVVKNDDVNILFEMQLENENVGTHSVIISKYELTGSNKNNYKLKDKQNILDTVFVEIIKAPLTIIADNKSFDYLDDEADLTYSVEGLISGDELTGQLEREKGFSVGDYKILQGTLNNVNYEITYKEALYSIAKKEISITPISLSKVYGENDPVIDFEISESGVDKSHLTGFLSRESGENVGSYEINRGTLQNENFDINLIVKSFEILKRDAQVSFNIKDKVYDGSDLVNEVEVVINNKLTDDQISIQFNSRFENKNAGVDKKIIIENEVATGANINNYNFVYNKEVFASINQRDIIINIESCEKTYGEKDPQFVFEATNVVNQEIVVLDFSRSKVENVGKHQLIPSISNSNYNIKSFNVAHLTINPAKIEIGIKNIEKFYGEEDPAFEIFLTNETKLQFDDKLEDVLLNKPERELGEHPRTYKITQGDLISNDNYEIKKFEEASLIILKKDVVVYADAALKIYGENDPVLTYSSSDFVDDPQLILSRETGENIGVYEIKNQTLNDYRYNITFIPSTLTINPREIVIIIDDKIKEYGNEDPVLSISIKQGYRLHNNDNLQSIKQGEVQRETGEAVGFYKIVQNTLSLGKNYQLSVEEGELIINQSKLEIIANMQEKFYGEVDPVLTFAITDGELKMGDKLQGELMRDAGENPGELAINIGNLVLSDNYELTFIPSVFKINKRPITIVADAVEKTFMEKDPLFTYEVSLTEGMGLCKDDVLTGKLFREKDAVQSEKFENTGKYEILSTLNNNNYEISYVKNYLTILQKEIKIIAEDKESLYGDPLKPLTYTMEGEVVDGSILKGQLYKTEGLSAGVYDIRSTFTLGRNYKITYKKAKYTIIKIDIVLKTSNYEKEYGAVDPVFDFNIVSGDLIEGQVLVGQLSREKGDDVGDYLIIPMFNNNNYNISIEENCHLKILPKKVNLILQIHDKVYNGDDVAYIRTPRVNGLIDEGVFLAYDREASARFHDSEVGENKDVRVFDIALVGEKAFNYELVYPEYVTGNITLNEVATSNSDFVITTTNNTILESGVEIKVEEITASENLNLDNKILVQGIKISLIKDSQNIENKNVLTLKIKIDDKFKNRQNFYVYVKEKDGSFRAFQSSLVDGYAIIETDSMEEIFIAVDDDVWLDYAMYTCICLTALILIIFGTVFFFKKRKVKKISA